MYKNMYMYKNSFGRLSQNIYNIGKQRTNWQCKSKNHHENNCGTFLHTSINSYKCTQTYIHLQLELFQLNHCRCLQERWHRTSNFEGESFLRTIYLNQPVARSSDVCYRSRIHTRNQPYQNSNVYTYSHEGRGAGAGGGGKGGNCPPNLLSQWDGYACAPPPLNFGNH